MFKRLTTIVVKSNRLFYRNQVTRRNLSVLFLNHHHHHHGIQTNASSSKFYQRLQPQRRMMMSSAATTEEFIMVLPSMGDSITEGTLLKWLKNVGDFVADDEIVASVETEKVVADITAPKGGVILELYAKEGEKLAVGANFVRFGPGSGSSTSAPKTTTPKASETPITKVPTPAVAAPSPTTTTTTTTTTIQKVAPLATPPATTAAAAAPSKPSTPAAVSLPGSRNETRVKMPRIRQTIANRLMEAHLTTARLTTFNEIDMSKLMNLRSTYKDLFQEKYGQKLGFMSAFVAASCIALKEIPAVNACIQGDEIVYHDYVDMSIAVSSPRGLVVPVLRNAESMNFAQIEGGIAVLAEKAKNATLSMEDMTGGTFTVTNGGVFGSLLSTPMINLPQSAILGMHNIVKRPVVITNEKKQDEIVIRPIMMVALSYDHRLIDGRESVTFLKSVKDKLENPERLVLGL